MSAARSTQTPRLGLNKPDPGGDIDVWGDEINANADILDNALLAAQAQALYLPIAGGTLTGPLVLSGAPTQPLHAASKLYVDTAAPQGGPYLPIGGGTLTGPLALSGTPTQPLHAASKAYVDTAAPAGGPYLPIAGGALIGVLALAADPAAPLQAATKQYVDASVAAGGPYLPLAGGQLTGPLLAGGSVGALWISETASLPVPLGGSKVQIVATVGGNPKVTFDAYGGNAIFAGRSSNGTPVAPTPTPQDRGLVGLNGYGFGATVAGPVVAQLFFKAAQPFTDTAQGAYMQFLTTAIGTTAIVERMRLDDSGSLLIGLTARSGTSKLQVIGGATIDTLTTGNAGFNSTPPIAKPTLTGAWAGNAAGKALAAILASYGLITDGSTA